MKKMMIGLLTLTSLNALAMPDANEIREYVNLGKISGIEKFIYLKHNQNNLFKIESVDYYCMMSTDPQQQYQYQDGRTAITIYPGVALKVDKNLICCE